MTFKEVKAQSPSTSDASEGAPPTKGKVVLVVDDSPVLLIAIRQILEMEDYEVFTALSGAEAFAVLANISRPDLILLDMQMVGMSGPEFLLALEENRPEIIENVPVVFVTGMDKVPASKAVGFIKKPFNMDEFSEAIHGFIKMGICRPVIKH